MLKAEEERFALRVYMTDALMALTENTAGPGGRYMTKRWAELFGPETPEKAPEDIARDVMRGAGLKFGR
jgi:hypothetical protein